MRARFAIFGLLALFAGQAAFADDSEPWVVGGDSGRILDSWPPETNKVFVSEYLVDGGTRLCSITISPRMPGPSRHLSIQHFQGQSGFTFVAHQEDWLILRGTVVQLSAIFDRQISISLIGTGFGQEIKLGSDFAATSKLNTLLSESETLDIQFPGQPGLTWRIGLQGVPKAMAKLRLCASKPVSS
ncbi:hypothetical protein F1602_15850 [Pseudomonas putida]|nr:hypothetical protein F1602_15850 [Pseudomonas putida]